jgi:hypothetical protein
MERLDTPVTAVTQAQLLGQYDRTGSHTETLRAAVDLLHLVDTTTDAVILTTADGINITLNDHTN